MKVAHLTTVDSSLRYLLLAQLSGAVGAGAEVIGISAGGSDVPALEASGVRHIHLRSSTRRMDIVSDVRAAMELFGILRRERVDVLHTHNPKPGVYGRVVGRLTRVPVVVNTVHGLYATTDDSVAKRAAVYALEALASRCSDAELIQNPEDLDLMRKLRLAPSKRLRYLGNGVDLERFDPERFDRGHRARVLEQFGVDAAQVVIGTVGRLVEEKGYPELFDALERLGSGVSLVVVGPDDATKADALPLPLVDAARRRGVVFLGHRSDVDALYAAFDVFVLPSRREGFPRAAMEAAAMGLPIVAADVRGSRQVVEHGVNGLLVPPRDAPALVAALSALAADEVVRRAMGAAGRVRALREFDERRVVATVLDTYWEIGRRKGLDWAAG